MVRHIVLFQFTSQVTEENREEILEKMRDSVANMNGDIPGLLYAELGENQTEGYYDIIFYSELKEMENILTYRTHPLHVAHQKMTQDWVQNRTVIDYQVNEKKGRKNG